MLNLLFYVSGHGYGHARRMTRVMLECRTRIPSVKIRIRSAAPPGVFQPLPPEWVLPSEIDAGLLEVDPLTIDREASLQRLIQFMNRREEIIAGEVAAVQTIAPDLIVADVPFLAGDVARRAEIPCLGISNFTWDWIYAHLFQDDKRYSALAPAISASYAKFSTLLELPFGCTSDQILKKIPVPLVAMRSTRDPGEVLAQIGISPDDHRPRVLIGTRGGLAAGTLAKAAASASEFLFLCPHEPPDTLPANGINVPIGPGLDFSDVLRVSHVIISKLGYGMVSECIATPKPLVYPPRVGFVEDDVMEQSVPRYIAMERLSAQDYREGNWGDTLRRALQLPTPIHTLNADGARACAEFIARFAT